MNSDSRHERFCAGIDGASMSQAEALDLISYTLYVDNPSQDWDGIGSGRVFFLPRAASCGQLFYGTQVDIKFWVKDSVDEVCGGSYSGCAQRSNPQWDPLANHDEYRDARVYLERDSLQGGDRSHLISHEVGHVLGLRDGGPSAPNPGPYPGAECLQSVMHSYGCTDYDWPTFFDRLSVELLMPSGGSGGGGISTAVKTFTL
jgi:hypothetical protein